ncbi:MAG: AgmX/PglI C-terminal domain-containing protein [Proteobacteria bacterium]|nr:AgmX/PglI C-terminal domain-containing protein [Pseudomonadota bacterium]
MNKTLRYGALILVTLMFAGCNSAPKADPVEPKEPAAVEAPKADEPPLSQDQIKAVVDKHMEELAICYNQANECEDPEDGAGDVCAPIEGTLVLKWTVKKDGTVSAFEIDRAKSSFYNEFVDTCITKNENSDPWVFPKTDKDEFSIDYSIAFKRDTFFPVDEDADLEPVPLL